MKRLVTAGGPATVVAWRRASGTLTALAFTALIASCGKKEPDPSVQKEQAGAPVPVDSPPKAAPATEPAPMSLDTKTKRVSYCIGLTMMNSFKAQAIDVDGDAFVQGVRDSLPGGKSILAKEETEKIMKEFQQEMRAKQQAKMAERMAAMNKQREAAAKDGPGNKMKGEAFLAANAKRPGVVTLPSGLQYKILKEGTGRRPTRTEKVVCHYRGTFVDGKEFDSSHKRGRPAEFPVTGVIRGWTEALLLMKVGAKWQLFIPPELAYGPSGRGAIGPNQTLLFEIDLLGIK